MRGAWRPLVVYLGMFAAVQTGLALARGPMPWTFHVGTGLAVAPFFAVLAVLGPWRSGRFVRGLRDAGEVVEVESDAVDWWGDRRTVVRGVHGTWTVVGVGGKAPRVDVTGPGDAYPWRANGDERKAALAAVERVAHGAVAAPPPREVTPAKLASYALAFYGIFVFLGLVFAGPRGALWTAVVAGPFFAWLGWRIHRRGRPLLQDSSGRVLDP